MLCKSPYVKGALPYPCGQCLPCRVNRRRVWTHRMLLESYKHQRSAFVTLTYNKENLPEGGTLVPEHLTLWLKRLRYLVQPVRFRYFACGEYGGETWRPHYHACLFGIGGEAQYLVQQAWGKGFTQTGGFSREAAAYVAGYVTKKMTKADDERLKGRHPEFARMSRNGSGGIGAGAMEDVSKLLFDKHGAQLVAEKGDVPQLLMHGPKRMPLGRYLSRKLREEMGFENVGGQEKPMEQWRQEMFALRSCYSNRQLYEAAAPYQEKQKIRQLEVKAAIFAKKEKL